MFRCIIVPITKPGNRSRATNSVQSTTHRENMSKETQLNRKESKKWTLDVLDLFLQVVPQLLPDRRILRIGAGLANARPWDEVL